MSQTKICLRWLEEKYVTKYSNGGFMVIYHGRTKEIMLNKHKQMVGRGKGGSLVGKWSLTLQGGSHWIGHKNININHHLEDHPS